MEHGPEHLLRLFLEHSSVSTDTRSIAPGGLFFALRGARFDGNAFATQALEKGAAYAVVSDRTLAGERYVHVDDTLEALQSLATQYRQTFGIPVLAITGSNGKTTTKELIGAVLSAKYPTHVTHGNFNNHIGVPLTLLGMPRQTQFAVVEMGANHIGEIAALCNIARPTHGIITNIGMAHLEGFGGLEGVKRGKSELYYYLAEHNGFAFVNDRLDHLKGLSAGVASRCLYRLGEQVSFDAYEMTFAYTAGSEAMVIDFEDASGAKHSVCSDMFGAYNAQNIASAIAIGLTFGVPGGDIADRLSAYRPGNNRSQRISIGELHVIMDAYNANPSSMQHALESFAAIPGPRYVVLGDMLELGEHTEEAHAAVVRTLEDYDLAGVFLVGKYFAGVAADKHYEIFADTEALCTYFTRHGISQGAMLVKGSRSMQLERLLTVLQ